MDLTLKDFDYELPKELIAQRPAEPRDHARLLVYNRSDRSVTDDHFFNLHKYLPRAATLVVNNSKVEKCRLLFDEGSREIFVINTLTDRSVQAMVRPGKQFKKGRKLLLAEGVEAEVTGISADGIRTLKLNRSLDDPLLEPFRSTPFPPYIRQDESLAGEYQTVYARPEGSKAAPTAGLHFTPRMIGDLESRGYGWEEVTLHVGLGTFAPVKSENLDQHVMHSEWYRMSGETAENLNRTRHITAVGTTSVRVLESAVTGEGRHFRASSGETGLFIRPGYAFRAVDSIVTNFHLPKSTLLMMIAAFTGFDEMHRIYRHAIGERYRFYSFGDAMLLL